MANSLHPYTEKRLSSNNRVLLSASLKSLPAKGLVETFVVMHIVRYVAYRLTALLCFLGIVATERRAYSQTVAAADLTDGGHPDWRAIVSVRDLFSAYPETIAYLFSALNPDYPSLQDVRKALLAKDTILACEALLTHFRKATNPQRLQDAFDSYSRPDFLSLAGSVVNDTVTIGHVKARIPQRGHGAWDWNFTGPEGDDEFGYSLNDHRYLLAVLAAWKSTGDNLYAETFDRIIKDWIIHNPLPEEGDSIYLVLKHDNQLDWRDLGEVRWRDLETGQRLGESWPYLFYGFQHSDAFSSGARLLMLFSIAQQAEYLRRYHKEGHNWTTMEMNGLALAGLAFPEFRNARHWVNYAFDVMSKELSRQVYPDGVQKELSTKTQWVALSRFEMLADHLANAGEAVPQAYVQRMEQMYNYLAYVMRPDGHQPLNNDSDRDDLRPRILKAARKFNRPDWIWIATNGKEGKAPDSLPSVTFPWSGVHVTRSNWEPDAHWAFFDTGAFGTGHQHADKLHVSVSAFGRDLLVDGGRYTHENYWSFDPTTWRGYFRSSFSHNVILVDGKGQKKGPLTFDEPLKNGVDFVNSPSFYFARGTFSDGFEAVEGLLKHTRTLLYLKDKYWIVVDQIITDRPRNISALWHYAPHCHVTTDGGTVTSSDAGQGNLRIVPAAKTLWDIELIKGQTEPVIQGWYSETYGKKEPSTTAVFSTEIKESIVLAWLLVPALGAVPNLSLDIRKKAPDKLHVRVKGMGKPVSVALPLNQGLPTIQ